MSSSVSRRIDIRTRLDGVDPASQYLEWHQNTLDALASLDCLDLVLTNVEWESEPGNIAFDEAGQQIIRPAPLSTLRTPSPLPLMPPRPPSRVKIKI